MATILAYTSPSAGHLFPMLALLCELIGRGHRVHVRTHAAGLGAARAAGLSADRVDSRIEDIVSEESKLVPHPGVVLVKSVDGIGSPAAKVQTWQRIVARTPKHVKLGFKLFFEEDVERGKRLMTPQEVLDLTPTPDYVLYE